ncbi:MAG: hypothetical protein MUC50_06540 [Myxococcota bacterium]|nr:hypothetical protein [Myxococcota bacterium]
MLGFFGQYLVESGLIDYLQLDLGLSLMNERNKRFGELAAGEGLLTVDDADALQQKQRILDKYIGELAVEEGLFSTPDVQRLLDTQRRNHLRIGAALVELGVMDRDDLERAFQAFASEQAAASGKVSLIPAGPFEPMAAHLKSQLPRRIQRSFGDPAKLGGTEVHRPLPRFEVQAMLGGCGGFTFALDVQRRWLRGMHRSQARDSEVFASDDTMKKVARDLLCLVASTAAVFEGRHINPDAFPGEPTYGELPYSGAALSLVTPHGRALLVLSTAD